MSERAIYVIGAGLAGLAAAVALAREGHRVEVIEGAAQAGGRCRSYFDPLLQQVIDNGNHLVLSGNHATFDYLRVIGSAGKLSGPEHAEFAFMDLATGARWTVSPNEGPLPWWIFADKRRVPATSPLDYASFGLLLAAHPGKRIRDVVSCKGRVWTMLLRPLLLAALNTEPEDASADLAAAIIRETLARGGAACRPRIASPTLAAVFIDPALAYLRRHGIEVRMGRRVHGLSISKDCVNALGFTGNPLVLAPNDLVILATPAWAVSELLPDITAPNEFRGIVNAHFQIAPPQGAARIIGVIGGTAEWVLAFHDRLSVTVSGADRLIDSDREALARTLWADVARVHGLVVDMPPWQIVKERRATFAATPEQAARRRGAQTHLQNLILAGDWTNTGLPGTIEGAIRSGNTAARLALELARV